MHSPILIRGAGDLASGVAIRLLRADLHVVMTELAQPLAVRRTVSFAEAVFEDRVSIEGVVGQRVAGSSNLEMIAGLLDAGKIPVLVDPHCESATVLQPAAIVDARMRKSSPGAKPSETSMFIGLGPGFTAGVDCDAVVETERGHTMGRVIWRGPARADSSSPDGDARRVLRAPTRGVLRSRAHIGQHFDAGDVIAEVGGQVVDAPFSGVLRGLLHPGLTAEHGMKIGDLDARDDPALCQLVSDKALSVGGGVLEALLGRDEVRGRLWA